METKVTSEEDGSFVVQVRRTFRSMEEAQHYAATVQFGGEKVDKRKLRPRAFDEFCEYLPDSTRTLKRAQCKICVKLFGHMSGVTQSTFTLEWTVGQDHQHEVKERENNEASRHLRAKVVTAEGVMTVKDLHEMYKRDPEKFATAAPPPPHQPIIAAYNKEAFELENAIECGETLTKEVYNMAKEIGFAVIAMQEPVMDSEPLGYRGGPNLPVDLEKRAKTVLAKHGVTLSDVRTNSMRNVSMIETFLCGLPRSKAVDLALYIYQKLWYQGVHKAVKNMDYFQYVLSRFHQARAAHEEAMELVQEAFGDLRLRRRWYPCEETERILAATKEEAADSDE